MIQYITHACFAGSLSHLTGFSGWVWLTRTYSGLAPPDKSQCGIWITLYTSSRWVGTTQRECACSRLQRRAHDSWLLVMIAGRLIIRVQMGNWSIFWRLVGPKVHWSKNICLVHTHAYTFYVIFRGLWFEPETINIELHNKNHSSFILLKQLHSNQWTFRLMDLRNIDLSPC